MASAGDVKRWIAGFDAAKDAAVDARRLEGPQPDRAIRLALSLIEAARAHGGGRLPADARRADSEAAVWTIWATLHRRLTPR